MAKKKASVNKAKAVRDFLKTKPNAKNAEVAAGLKKKGITISANYVSVVKSNARPKKKRRKRAVAAPVAAAPQASGVDVATVVSATQLIEKVGSVSKAKSLIDQIAKASK